MAVASKSKGAGRWFQIELFGRELPLYWTWIVLGALLVVVHLMIRLQAKESAFQFLDAMQIVGEGVYRNVDYGFGGTVVVHDVAIQAWEPEPGGEPIRIGRIEVETPGLFWLLRASLPSFTPRALQRMERAARVFGADDEQGPEPFPPADRLVLRFEELDWGHIGLPPLGGAFDWIGPHSAALFEAAGCERDWWWTAAEVRSRFGGAPGPTRMEIVFEAGDAGALSQVIRFDGMGGSQLRIEREFTLPGDAEDFLDVDPGQWRTRRVRWVVEDTGFNRARNRECARESRIAESVFVERHLAAVRRILRVDGFEPDATVVAAYRAFATRGGTLTWETRLEPGRALEEYEGHAEAALLSGMNARLSVSDGPAATWTGAYTAAAPFPEDQVLDSVVILMRGEGSRLPGDGASETASAPTQEPALAAGRGGVAAVAAAPGQVAAAPASPAPDAPLRPAVGHTVRVVLHNGRAYMGRVLALDDQRIQVEVMLGGGRNMLSFVHEAVREVEVLAAAPSP